WEILNCYQWDDGEPINQCYNFEFYVIHKTAGGDQAFISFLEGAQCLTDSCEAIVKLPLVPVLTPLEYAKYKMGLMVIKEINLHLAFGGEEDRLGRIVGRKLASASYHLKFILNGTGFERVAIIRMER
ncbi:MAG: hypothetical protein AABY86_03210, partial [Bdellovibrionota bacterium]